MGKGRIAAVITDVAAHVLRLDHAPVTAALVHAGRIVQDAHVRFERGDPDGAIREQPNVLASNETARYADVAFLRTCPLCSGSRVCPDCGEPCEVCTVQPR
jgi:hypothetical protein